MAGMGTWISEEQCLRQGACEKGGQPDVAVSVLAERGQSILGSNVVSRNAAPSVCEPGGQWGRVFDVTNEMRQQTLEVDVLSCSAANDACVTSWQRERTVSERRAAAHQPYGRGGVSDVFSLAVRAMLGVCGDDSLASRMRQRNAARAAPNDVMQLDTDMRQLRWSNHNHACRWRRWTRGEQ